MTGNHTVSRPQCRIVLRLRLCLDVIETHGLGLRSSERSNDLGRKELSITLYASGNAMP
jgi:hypothetical protein